MKKGDNIYFDNRRNYFTFAEKAEKGLLEFDEGTTNDLPVRPGRPKEKRSIRRSSKKPQYNDYLSGLEKMVKDRTWSAFVTATFDRRYKTPYSIYEHKVLKKDYLQYLDDDWEPTEWEPTKDTCWRMMVALASSLQTWSHKRWRIFYVIEEHKDGTPHIHFLLGNSRWGHGDIKKVSEIWRFLRGGYIKIDEFTNKKQSTQKAIEYQFKYLTKQSIYDWDYLYTMPEQFRIKKVGKDYFRFEDYLQLRKRNHHIIETGRKKPHLRDGVSLDF